MKRTKMPKLRNGSKDDSNPGSLDCESGVLPLSYRHQGSDTARRHKVIIEKGGSQHVSTMHNTHAGI